ncbi:roadblock/LC7 domain-containing protein [Streptomyces sp. GS7]|uniref:roadblock/LC7 domain-containing protein n=1 Tax=Streptomyces sp. GS7 TaxID=2692234 RepID=UPI00131859B8|nr:roadblock/LC7 domain-containing protein [Streptomyces sp. GS7]QHC24191.1 roadblock/LC7 domain-containing protein [Streptomyces sp. GS7]
MNYDLSWMLDSALELPEAQHAILVSADGLLMARSKDVGRDHADTVAAAMSGMQSLSRTVADFCSATGPNTRPQWRQTLVEFDHGWVFLISAGEGAYLAVSASPDVDMAEITFRMQQLVGQLGKALTSPPRERANIQP